MFLTETELQRLGFRKLGKNVKISDRASLYNCRMIELGDNVRIDDFCVLSAGQGGIEIGNNVHIACYCSLIGKEKISMKNFSGLSSRVSIYSSTDDYSGNFLTNPTVPEEFTGIISGEVCLEKHVIVGCGSVILPGVTIGNGSAIGALSLVTKSIEDFCLCAGVPAKKIKERNKKIIDLEWEYLRKEKSL